MEFAVIGLGRFGRSVALTLVELGHSVLGVDREEARVQAVSRQLTHAVQADATDEETLNALGVRNFDAVVVGIGANIEASVLVTLMLKQLGVPRVVAKASSELHGRVLERVGADRVVFPEREMGVRIARRLVAPGVLDLIELTPDVSVEELTAAGKIAGRTLRELDLRAKYGVTVLAIRRGEDVEVSPRPDVRIQQGDVLVVIGRNEQLLKVDALTR
jgi:trk system potassium uptake protein TrkA